MQTNHYLGFWADYSRVCHVPDDAKLEPMKLAETIALREEKTLPAIGLHYRAEAVGVQNKEWWPGEALRQPIDSILTAESCDFSGLLTENWPLLQHLRAKGA